MREASYRIFENEPTVRLTLNHLQNVSFSLVIVMPDEVYTPRKWWQFWEPKWVVDKAYSFFDPRTQVAHLTQTDYGIYRAAVAKRNSKDT